jgi:hypothetical protein
VYQSGLECDRYPRDGGGHTFIIPTDSVSSAAWRDAGEWVALRQRCAQATPLLRAERLPSWRAARGAPVGRRGRAVSQARIGIAACLCEHQPERRAPRGEALAAPRRVQLVRKEGRDVSS